MNITDIRIRRTFENESKLKALVSITFGNTFALHDIKVIDGSERLFVAMPAREDENGDFRDIAHPITADFRRELEQKVLEAYAMHLEQKQSVEPTQEADLSAPQM